MEFSPRGIREEAAVLGCERLVQQQLISPGNSPAPPWLGVRRASSAGCGAGDARAAQRLLVRETMPRLPASSRLNLVWAGSGGPMGTALLVGLGSTASRVWARSEPRENRCSLLLARVKRRQLLAAGTQAATGEPGEDAAGTASVQEVDRVPATAARPVASESKPFSPKSLLLCRRVPCSFLKKKRKKKKSKKKTWECS